MKLRVVRNYGIPSFYWTHTIDCPNPGLLGCHCLMISHKFPLPRNEKDFPLVTGFTMQPEEERIIDWVAPFATDTTSNAKP